MHQQRDGLFYLGVAPNVGRTSGTQLWQVADLAETYGSGTIRTTTTQKLLILDVPGDRVADLTGELSERDLQVNPSAFRRGTMACTGIEFCKLAIVETKQRAVDLYAELDRRLPGFDTPISININGCPNSCARFQIADIGLKGSTVDGGEGFQMHLGGSLGTAVLAVVLQRALAGVHTVAGAASAYGTAFWASASIAGVGIVPCILLLRAERAARRARRDQEVPTEALAEAVA